MFVCCCCMLFFILNKNSRYGIAGMINYFWLGYFKYCYLFRNLHRLGERAKSWMKTKQMQLKLLHTDFYGGQEIKNEFGCRVGRFLLFDLSSLYNSHFLHDNSSKKYLNKFFPAYWWLCATWITARFLSLNWWNLISKFNKGKLYSERWKQQWNVSTFGYSK